jgi:hypothetical protein
MDCLPHNPRIDCERLAMRNVAMRMPCACMYKVSQCVVGWKSQGPGGWSAISIASSPATAVSDLTTLISKNQQASMSLTSPHYP